MKKKRVLAIILIVLVLIIGIISLILYKLGDRMFNEAIDSQIQEIETALEQMQIEPQDTSNPGAQLQNDATIIPSAPVASSQDITKTQKKSAEAAHIPTILPHTDEQISALTQPNQSTIPNIQVTIDKLENVKEAITPADKMNAAALVLKKLSQADINTLTKLVAGGITPEEKAKIKDIVYSRFTQEEINEIREMYIKYMK